MNKKLTFSVLIIFGISLVLMGQYGRHNRGGRGQNNSPGQGYGGPGGDCGYLNQLPYEEVSATERQHLLDLREEEKLARDVYLHLGKHYNLRIFERIASSESWHMEAVKRILDKYQIQDPVGENAPGQFSNPKYQDLYQSLITEGEASLGEALKVGAKIEDMDIFDLQKALQVSDNQDIKVVYQNLAKGSRNHLRSFISQLQTLQISYVPQFISQEMFDSIINSSWERGPVDINGQPRLGGRGYGRGNGTYRNW